MKIVVCVKQVASASDDIELTDDQRDVDTDFLDLGVDEWDSTATEAAIQLKESSGAEVVLLTAGGQDAEPSLRRLLAMGADRAVRVVPSVEVTGDPLAAAATLAAVVLREAPDLVLCGVQSSDAGHGATGTALAGHLGWPAVTVVRALEVSGTGLASVERELEGGLSADTEVQLPAVLTVQTGLNHPRYANLRAIKLADASEIEVVAGVDIPGHAHVRRMYVPERASGAEMQGSDPHKVAERIVELVKERLK